MSNQQNEKLEKMTAPEHQLWKIRHSAEHVLMMAMENLGFRFHKAMGPATSDGFYFDFELLNDTSISADDFPRIEKEMQKIMQQDLSFVREEVTVNEARQLFQDNPYKQEWIDEVEARKEPVTIYWTGKSKQKSPSYADVESKQTRRVEEAFVDLCAGPHVESTSQIGAFKLLSIAGAYWRGSEDNKMLTRIYGTAFPTRKELDEYLTLREEAQKRDHKKLGKELDLFFISDTVGQGLPLFTEKGASIRRELERWVVDEELERGYIHVSTPDLARTRLFEISGHFPYYADTMYPVMEVDETKLVLRPMTCPHHFMIYQHHPRSYRELPLRIAELAKLYRYEQSGELSGLQRVRGFCLADAHIFCREDQAHDEVKHALQLIDDMAQTLGLKRGHDYRFRLSQGDPENKEKYYDDPDGWRKGERVLKEVLDDLTAPYYEAANEAAFYGPKIDVQMRNVYGKEDTAFTVQYDFCLPARFELKYIDESGNNVQPVVIHRSSIGAIERTLAFLIEFYAGAFPVWLHPTQVVLLPISQDHLEYAGRVGERLKEKLPGLRLTIDDSNETIQKKIRAAQLQKTPYMLVVGKKEVENQTVNVRLRTGDELGEMQIDEFANRINERIRTKALTL